MSTEEHTWLIVRHEAQRVVVSHRTSPPFKMRAARSMTTWSRHRNGAGQPFTDAYEDGAQCICTRLDKARAWGRSSEWDDAIEAVLHQMDALLGGESE